MERTAEGDGCVTLDQIKDVIAGIRIPEGITAEQIEKIVQDARCSDLSSDVLKKFDECASVRRDVISISEKLDKIKPALTAEQSNDLKKAANASDVVLDAIAQQNARIDDLAMSGASRSQAPSDSAPYLTSREQFDVYNKIISRRDAEFADRQFMTLLEQICEMREDFRRLVAGMDQNIANMKAEDVLASFKTYQVDLDNMLRDAGVRFGAFGTQGQVADANLQRLVGVVETDDPSKEGTVAKRLSSGYEYKGRAVYKEKVMVYRTRKT